MQGEICSKRINARALAEHKQYRYILHDNISGSRELLKNIEHIRAACRALVGTHDFAAFRSRRCTLPSTVKTIYALDVLGPLWHPNLAPQLVIRCTGNGFLRRMVRIIVGTLAEVGLGQRTVASVQGALASGRRQDCGPAASADGLCLEWVAVGAGYNGA